MDAPLLESDYLDWYLMTVINSIQPSENNNSQINNEISKLQNDINNIYLKIDEINKRLDDCKC